MMIRSCLTYLFLAGMIFLAADLQAQRKDFRTWLETEFSTDLGKDLGMSLELEQRFRDNSTVYDRSLMTLGLKYDMMKSFDLAGGIRFLTVADRDGNIGPKYRMHADAVVRNEVGDIRLSLRTRFQYGFEEFIAFNEMRSNSFINRYRLKAAYKIFGTPLEAFGSAEAWGLFASKDGRFLKRMRYAAGLGYKLKGRSELGLRYIMEDEFNQVNPMQSHILVGSFSYKF